MKALLWIAGGALLINNLLLSYGLGLYPCFASGSRIGLAVRLGLVTTGLSVLMAPAVWLLNTFALVHAPYLRLISFVVLIVILTQAFEAVVQRIRSGWLQALGEFTPFSAASGVLLGLALLATEQGYGLLEGLALALGAGLGFTLAAALIAGLCAEVELLKTPTTIRGLALQLLIAGILSLAFLGFTGFF